MNAPGNPIDSAPAWMRLGIATLLSTIGGVGMWSVVVVLPAVQDEFGVARGEASLPYTLTMVGFAFGGVLLGRLADRFGVILPLLIGAIALAVGYVAAAYTTSSVAVRARAWAADWHARQFGYVRPAAGGHVALVCRAGGASRSRSARQATTWPARSGRRWCSTSSRPGLAADLHRSRAGLCGSPCHRWPSHFGVHRRFQQPSP